MSDEADTEFSIILRDEGRGGAGAEPKFQIQGTNATGGSEQPDIWIDSDVGKWLAVQCRMSQVCHGTLTAGGFPGSLLVMQFEFEPRHNYRRFIAVNIEMVFEGVSSGAASPEVVEITPRRTWAMTKSTKKVKVRHTIGPKLEAGQGGVKAVVGYKWELEQSVDKENWARVTGMIRGSSKDRAKENTVTWNLNENSDTKSGIPTFMQTAILLKRRRTPNDAVGEKFKVTIDIHGEVDWRTGAEDKLKTMRGQKQKGQDVIFNPTVNKGKVKDSSNLQKEDLAAYKQIITVIEEVNDGKAKPPEAEDKDEAAEVEVEKQDEVEVEEHDDEGDAKD